MHSYHCAVPDMYTCCPDDSKVTMYYTTRFFKTFAQCIVNLILLSIIKVRIITSTSEETLELEFWFDEI